MAMLIGINSCKKGLNDKQAQTNAALMTKFYATTQKTKPATKRLIEYIKNNDKLGNLDAFVKKYGFPIWDKAIVMPQSNFAARGENEDDFIVVPTILEDDYKVNGFIAAEINENITRLKTYLDIDYKQIPYKNTTTVAGVTAEDFVGLLMELWQEVYGKDRFKMIDPLLNFAGINTINEKMYLHIGGGTPPLQKGIFYSDPLPRDGCTYTCQGQEDDNGNWVQITPWTLLKCPENTVNQLLELPTGGGGGGGASGAGDPPIKPLTVEEICKMNFSQMMYSTEDANVVFSSSPQFEDGTNPLQRPVNIGWTIATNPFGWVVNTYWNGVIKRLTYNSNWTWDTFVFDKVDIDGTVIGGKVTPSMTNLIITHDPQKKYAIPSIKVKLQYDAGCGGSPLSHSENISKWTSFGAGDY